MTTQRAIDGFLGYCDECGWPIMAEGCEGGQVGGVPVEPEPREDAKPARCSDTACVIVNTGIADDAPCNECSARPEHRKCADCLVEAWITDCGHLPQPRPIAAGRADGTEMHLVFCSACAA